MGILLVLGNSVFIINVVIIAVVIVCVIVVAYACRILHHIHNVGYNFRFVPVALSQYGQC